VTTGRGDAPAALESREPQPLRTIRAFLLAVLTLGLLGTATDLLLLGHYEDAWQLPPLILIAIGLLTIAALVVTAAPLAVITLRITMVLSILAGGLGVYLHYSGNREFQHELDPNLGGWALFTTVMTAKAPPALAPGAMVQLGLIGLVVTYRHPAMSRSGGRS
jgi:hypothetical protein